MLLAGGTEVVPLLRDGLLDAPTRSSTSRARAARHRRHADRRRRRRWPSSRRAPQIPDALREACRLAASPQLRNMGTVGGNLLQSTRCWYWRLDYPCRLHGGDTLPRARRRAPRARDLRATTSAPRRIRPTSPPRCSRSARRCGRTGASSRSASSTGCRPTDDRAHDDARARRGDARARGAGGRRVRLPEGDGPQALGVPARRRRRRPARRRDDGRARRRRADPVAARRARSTTATPLPGTAYKVEIAQALVGARAPRRIDRGHEARSTARCRCSSGRRCSRRCGGGGAAPTAAPTRPTRTAARPSTAPSRRAPAARTSRSRRPRSTPGKTYDVTMKTNCGSFTIRLDQAQSPNAAASFVSLVQHGFFDDTVFHRIVPGFVIQGGDPTATGTGGPGYSTVDTPPASATLHARRRRDGEDRRRGRRARPAASSSSSPAPNAGLPPDYAIIGKVTKGLDVVDRIGKLGDAERAADRGRRDREGDRRELRDRR